MREQVMSVDVMGERARAPSMTRAGWLAVTAPLWPLRLARLLYGFLWWQQSGWKVRSDDFGRKSGGGLWYWVQHPWFIPGWARALQFAPLAVGAVWALAGVSWGRVPSPVTEPDGRLHVSHPERG